VMAPDEGWPAGDSTVGLAPARAQFKPEARGTLPDVPARQT